MNTVGVGTALPGDVDVLIVGAGIAGLCTSLYLARAGREVLAVDAGEIWGDASGANAGTLSLQVKHPDAWALTEYSLRLWEALDSDLGGGLGFHRPGGLRVATTEAERERLHTSVAHQSRCGLPVELWEGEALRTLAPWLGEEVLAAGSCTADAYSSPLLAGPALIEAARSSGAQLSGNAKVESINRCGNGFLARVGESAIRCRSLVIAAGAWSAQVAELLGITVPLEVDVNMLSITEPAPTTMDRVVTHVSAILSLKQYPNGTCAIGGGWQGRGGLVSGDKEIEYENLLHNVRVAVQVVPALRHLNLVRTWSGFEGVSPDAVPILGQLPGCEGAYIAAGARGGYTQGPVQGKLLSDLITTGRTALDLTPFSAARFRS